MCYYLKNTPCGGRTHDHSIKSRALYRTELKEQKKKCLILLVGVEPTTTRLKVEHSTELS